jgi:hypothetical protein
MCKKIMSVSVLTPHHSMVYRAEAVLLKELKKVLMRIRILGLLFFTCTLLSACSSAEWVHPNKPSSEFANDYNRCENMVMNDPKLQQGSKLMVENATERCLQKDGWRLIER